MQSLTFGGPGFDHAAFIRQQPTFVRSKAKQILKALSTLQERAPTQQQQVLIQCLAYTANVLRYVGLADRQTLREHVDDETKDTVCKAIAAALKTEVNSTNFKRTGVMSEFASAALEAVTPWSKDDTFVSMVLDVAKPNSLGKTIGKLVNALNDDVKLDIEHAKNVVEAAQNCLLSVWDRSTNPSVGPFVSNGLFKAVMHVCNINHPRVNDVVVDIAHTIKMDATAVRQLLVDGKSARRHLEHALEVSRAEGSMAVHNASA
ncbi:MYND-type domain-containing protein [Pycnococcus provasolii]